MAQLGSKCLYVLQSKAREGGREGGRVLRERIRSDILRASSRNHLPSFSSPDPPGCARRWVGRRVGTERAPGKIVALQGVNASDIIALPVCFPITCSLTGGTASILPHPPIIVEEEIEIVSLLFSS